RRPVPPPPGGTKCPCSRSHPDCCVPSVPSTWPLLFFAHLRYRFHWLPVPNLHDQGFDQGGGLGTRGRDGFGQAEFAFLRPEVGRFATDDENPVLRAAHQPDHAEHVHRIHRVRIHSHRGGI